MSRKNPLMRRLRRFGRARGGAAAVEFALIAPMMIAVLFSSIEIINMLQSNQRVENTAISLADVISRDTEISNSEMTGLWTAVKPLMFPDVSAGMQLRVTSISIDSAGAGKVVWSEVCGLRADGTCGASTYPSLAANSNIPSTELPTSNTPNSSLIRVETTYNFQPIIGLLTVDTNRNLNNDRSVTVMSHTAFRRSRLVDPIPRVS
jgi:Flp pilus assembly protein TadG